MKFGKRSSANTPPDSELLSGYYSEDHFQIRKADRESEADDVSAAVASSRVFAAYRSACCAHVVFGNTPMDTKHSELSFAAEPTTG